MKRRIRFVLAVAAVVVAGGIIGFLRDPLARGREELVAPQEVTNGRDASEPMLAQPTGSRVWQDRTFECERVLGEAPGPPLLVPVEVHVDRAGAIYVLDWGDKSVKKFSTGGPLLTRYGGTLGRAPGEFTNPTDFDVDRDGSVWVCDPVNGMITVFAPDGSVARSIRPERPPHRIALLGDSGYVVMSSPGGEKLFTRYDRQDNQVALLGTIMENQMQLSIALDGRIAGDSGGGFAYCAYRAGVLGIFTAHSRPTLSFVHTIEHPGLPKILSRQSADARYTRVDPDAPVISRSISFVGDEVHVLVGDDRRKNWSVMDVYDVRAGGYRYSYSVPGDATAIRVHGTHVYAVADTTIAVWVMHPGEESDPDYAD